MTGNTFGASFATPTTATATTTAAAPDLVKDTSTAGFQRDVLEESTRQPVLVDFWAPWCGPCKQLQPIIERVVAESNGRVKLVKLNIDDHPSIPGQLGIQSIPAVIAFVGGRPVDGFMGAVPESQVRAFIDKVAGPAVDDSAAQIEEALLDARAQLDSGDIAAAADIYGAVLQADPENIKALAGLAECMLAHGQWERARELIDSLTAEQKNDPDIVALTAKIAQIEEARKLGDPRALERELAADPDNHAARVNLAKILNVEGNREAATDHLIQIMKQDRTWDDDGARRQLLQFLEVWGFKDPASVAARRKMSAILFS